MPICSFCKKHYKEPRGLTVFTFDGKTVHFCSSKCRRNIALKRDPRKVNWIKKEKKISKAEKEAEKKAELLEEKETLQEEKIESLKKPEEKKK